MSALVSRASRRPVGSTGREAELLGYVLPQMDEAATQELSLFRKRDHLGRPLPIARVASSEARYPLSRAWPKGR